MMSSIESAEATTMELSECCDTSGTAEGFSDAVTIWINKPHVVNRRLCGSRIQFHTRVTDFTHCRRYVDKFLTRYGYNIPQLTGQHFSLDKSSDHTSDIQSGSAGNSACDSDTETNGPETNGDCICDDVIAGDLLGAMPRESIEAIENSDHTNLHEISGLWCTEEDKFSIILRELLPKQPERHSNMPELIIFDRVNQTCTFYPLVSSTSLTNSIEVVYEFRYHAGNKNRIELYVSGTDQTRDSDRKLSLTWLKDVLLKKLSRWSETPNLKTSLTSLVLVPVDEYSQLYSELKNKYGLHFAKIWPESTDPQKFVFEDVSIATYLLLLWQQDRVKKGLTRKQSFVDLGCGNGLLVHILASEGHPGYGVDIRSRKIWALYGPETILKESTVTPSSDCLFQDSDWLIGNHSDELTPWIPVMAARSAYTCNYFVLPCCHYDFHAKFSYDPEFGKATDGQYQCYLNFVRHVGVECGFCVEEDVLRIPSTKRVCFIGRTRSYDQSCELEVDQSRQDFIERRCGSTCAGDIYRSDGSISNASSSDQWVQNFTPRDKIETVRNCVTISECVKNKVIETVFNTILDSNSSNIKAGYDGKPWRKGGYVQINKVCDLFDKLTLAELKNECGGLQTLLRNCSQVFQVSSGNVQLRDFTQENPFEGRKKKGRPSNKEDFHKTSLCWFYTNHPDGCPRQADMCMYAHGKMELREKPSRQKKT